MTPTSLKSIKVIQHNVLHWRTNKETLTLNYLQHNPDILLLIVMELKLQNH